MSSIDPAAIREHWNARAALGERAGTDDLLLKALEQRAIVRAIHTPLPVEILEVGCGRGETARLVAADCFTAHVTAIDASPAMIDAAQQEDGAGVTFRVGDVLDPPRGPFTVVYSQRCLINLTTWEAQHAAIDAIADRLAPGGLYLMCEHSQDGLDHINAARAQFGRPAITPPWHNRYLRQAELDTITSLELVRVEHFSACYYFLSRVLNDRLSSALGLPPAYDAPINRLALDLPSDAVDPRFAQGRLWAWRKR